MRDEIVWVAPLLVSDGGPDILISENLLDAWTGYAGDDYEAACLAGRTEIVGAMASNGVWVFGGNAGSACVGNVQDGVIIIRIVTAPEKFKLPVAMSNIPNGVAGPSLVLGKENDAMLMSAACVGDSINESDAVGISLASGSFLTSRRVVTVAGGEYLVYHFTQAKAHGPELRDWLYKRGIPLEHKDGAF